MRGIVVELQDEKCIVLMEDGRFLQQKNRGYSRGQEIEIQKKTAGKWLAMAAMLVLACTMSLGWFWPVGYVYMDINPSLRMEVNLLGWVVDAVPLNADAEKILDNGNIRGDVSDCMETVILKCRTKGYLPEDGDVEIHVFTTRTVLEEKVIETAAALERERVTVSVYEMTAEEHEKAVHYNMPAKRLDAIRDYTECFGGTLEENMEKLKGVTTPQILEQLREASGTPDTEDKVSYASERRLKAVRAYTDCFGGTREENFRLLRGLSTKEIWQMIHEKTGKEREALKP